MNRVTVGQVSGLSLGLIFFFRLPSLTNAIILIGAFSFAGTALGFLSKNYGPIMAATIGCSILALTIGISAAAPCTLKGLQQDPAKNPLTGEIAEDFDGFRVMLGCDKGQHPWYYQSPKDGEMLRAA
ncbi:hypothetical protein GLU64_01645 [Nanohaloarchaea archaeon]|nr:hypothetical protein [Candidatus Nanohaloarchaea archaeon]